MGRKVILIFILFLFSFTACTGTSILTPDPQAKIRDDYAKLINQHKSQSDTFEYAYMGSTLMINLFYPAPKVLAEANKRWAKDPVFQKELKAWYNDNTENNYIVVLAGIYAPKFVDDDLMETERFRVKLKLPNGELIESSKVKSFKKNNKFINDYFPVFTPWERVYMLQFKPNNSAINKYTEGLKCIFYWPGGEEELNLIVYEN